MNYKRLCVGLLFVVLLIFVKIFGAPPGIAEIRFAQPLDCSQLSETALQESVCWRLDTQVTLQETVFLRSDTGNCYYVAGDITLLDTGKLLTGTFLYATDTEGIMLTRPLADTLFHSIEAVGNQIVVNGYTYEVRGVLDGEDKNAYVSILCRDDLDNIFTTRDELTDPSLQYGRIYLPHTFLWGNAKEKALEFWLQKHGYPMADMVTWSKK